MFNTDYAVSVEARRLDVIIPDWFECIDLSKLNMMDPKYCVGGQLDWPQGTNINDCDLYGYVAYGWMREGMKHKMLLEWSWAGEIMKRVRKSRRFQLKNLFK